MLAYILAKSDVKNICNLTMYTVFLDRKSTIIIYNSKGYIDGFPILAQIICCSRCPVEFLLLRCPLEFLLDIQQSYFSTGRKVSNYKSYWTSSRAEDLVEYFKTY